LTLILKQKNLSCFGLKFRFIERLEYFWQEDSSMGSAKENYANAAIAVNYVKSKVVLGAANKGYDQLTTVGLVNLGLLGGRVFNNISYVVEGGDNDSIQEALRTAAYAKAFGAGNCTEQSAVAFSYLYEQEVRPIDWMGHSGHMFVIVGREDKGNISSRPETWNAEAYVCDPWKSIVYPAKEYYLHEPNTSPELRARAESILNR
jgi:hypothetical protein